MSHSAPCRLRSKVTCLTCMRFIHLSSDYLIHIWFLGISCPKGSTNMTGIPPGIPHRTIVTLVTSCKSLHQVEPHNTSEDCNPPGHMVQRLSSALQVRRKTARAVSSVLKCQKCENSPHIARLGRRPVTIPKNKVMEVECSQLNKRVLCGSHEVFEPNQDAPWPTGLTIRDQMIRLPERTTGK